MKAAAISMETGSTDGTKTAINLRCLKSMVVYCGTVIMACLFGHFSISAISTTLARFPCVTDWRDSLHGKTKPDIYDLSIPR